MGAVTHEEFVDTITRHVFNWRMQRAKLGSDRSAIRDGAVKSMAKAQAAIDAAALERAQTIQEDNQPQQDDLPHIEW